MQWNWILGPIVGAIIGYITNHIALRMLFKPHRAIYIGKWHVPFTPGLIPKGRPRLSRAVRDVLDAELLSADVLQEALLSESMLQKTEAFAEASLQKLLREESTPRIALTSVFGDTGLSSFESRAKREIIIFIMEKILDSGIERMAAGAALTEVKERIKGTAAAPLALFLDEKRTASMEDKLAQTIREMIATHAPGAMENMLEKMIHEGLDTPIGELLSQYDDHKDGVRSFLMEQYIQLIQKGLSGLVNTLDLGAIVEDKINALDNAELEALIVQIVSRELRAIEWLGGLLGAIMGLANSFF